VNAEPGNYCTTSPCACGVACNSSYEIDNGFNTFDSCQDGYDGLTRYEWVQDMNVTSLNGTSFGVGHTLEVKGKFWCSPEQEGAAFWYYNGSGWRNISFEDCYINPSGYVYYSYNFTLDKVVGNQTIRAIVAYLLEPTHTCGYQTGWDYSDTDDLVIYVGDSIVPSVTNITPTPGSIYELVEGLEITITASVTDNFQVSSVIANVSWNSNNELVIMSDSNGDGIYEGTFDNVTELTTYTVQIIANDTEGNINNSERTNFTVTFTANISIESPINGTTYRDSVIKLKFKTLDNSINDWVGYELNGNPNVTISESLNITVNNSDSGGTLYEDCINYTNLSQSFIPREDMTIREVAIKLRKNGTVSNASLEIRTDNDGFPSGIVLANGTINSLLVNNNSFGWVSVTLNATLNLSNGTRYWLFFSLNGSKANHYSWEANDDGVYEYGNYSNNHSVDLLFKIFDIIRYRTSFNATEGANSIKVYANNTLGVMRSSVLIHFTLDSTAPYYRDIRESGDPVEVGSQITLWINVSDNISTVDTVLVEINKTVNYSMTKATGSSYNYTFIPNSTGVWFYRFFMNDSIGNSNVTGLYNFTAQDNTAPSFIAINYTPNTTDMLDPNRSVSVSVNVSEGTILINVTLFYRESNGTSWNNVTMQASGDYYHGKFIPNTENYWLFKIYAKDVYNNENTSDIINLSIFYDWNWTITPLEFDPVGAVIGTNATVGNLTINNTGDYNLLINVSKESGVPTVYFNESLITVERNSTRIVEIKAKAPLTTAEYVIIFKIDALNSSASPNYMLSNVTVASYTSGPYLSLQILNYDPTVTQRDHVYNLTAKLTNIGNETATNTWINWTLPSGWSSRENLTAWIGDLAVGESYHFDISADVGPNATTGMVQIIARANCTEGKYREEIRYVNVSPYSTPNQTVFQETTTVISSGGGGSRSGGILKKIYITPEYKVLIESPSVIEILRGENRTISVNVTNTVKDTQLSSMVVSIEGPELVYTNVEPDLHGVLDYNEKVTFIVNFRVPYYTPEGKHLINITVEADASDERTGNTTQKKHVVFRRVVTLIILKTEKEDIAKCLVEAGSLIGTLENKGFTVSILKDIMVKARAFFNTHDYKKSLELCTEVKSLVEKAYEARVLLNQLQRDIENLPYTVEGTEEALFLAKEALTKGDFELALKRLKEAETILALERKTKENLGFTIKTNWRVLMYVMIVVVISGILISREIRLMIIDRKITALMKEEKAIREQIKELQDEYFNKKLIGSKAYKVSMAGHRKSMAELEEKRMKLELIRIGIIHKGKIELLQQERERLINLEKVLQKKYFIDKVIDKKSYENLLRQYKKNIIEVDERISMLKRKK